MKIEIDIDEKYKELAVQIKAPELTPDVEKLVSIMRMVNNQLVYTEGEMYESDLKLYEIEQELLEQDFLRISKQSIVNLRMIKSLKADINRKIRVTLKNGEQIVVSRMYSDELRRKLGLK